MRKGEGKDHFVLNGKDTSKFWVAGGKCKRPLSYPKSAFSKPIFWSICQKVCAYVQLGGEEEISNAALKKLVAEIPKIEIILRHYMNIIGRWTIANV